MNQLFGIEWINFSWFLNSLREFHWQLSLWVQTGFLRSKLVLFVRLKSLLPTTTTIPLLRPKHVHHYNNASVYSICYKVEVYWAFCLLRYLSESAGVVKASSVPHTRRKPSIILLPVLADQPRRCGIIFL